AHSTPASHRAPVANATPAAQAASPASKEPVLPTEIYGIPLSPKLAKLIAYMRKEKEDGRK
ncbi:MAG TPA: hypothetical protein PLC54_00450, partial [Spirochaetales bacterium]|nr:hypothetical protein [Spirochaetales bacterium]